MKFTWLQITILAAFMSCGLNTYTYAADKKPTLSIRHTPPKMEELAKPGKAFKLWVWIPNVRNLELKVTAVLSVDGKIVEKSLSGQLDENDRTIYSTDVRAPLVDLAYYFILEDRGGNIVKSPRYQISRPCLPTTKLTEVDIPTDLEESARATLLVKKIGELEQDIATYGYITEVLAKIQTLEAPQDE